MKVWCICNLRGSEVGYSGERINRGDVYLMGVCVYVTAIFGSEGFVSFCSFGFLGE